MKKLLFFLLLTSFITKGQEFPKIIPPSPNASTFHNYGNNSINGYTGALNLGIPIFNINQNGINLPITLNYSGGNGIRVSQQASQVGLGWNLNLNGMISRVIKDEADDDPQGYLHLPEIPDIILDENYNYVNNNFQIISFPLYDTEPDRYLINCLGLNFEFYIGKNNEILTIPRNNVKITPIFVNNLIDSFEVKDEYGIKYIFSQKESQQTGNIDFIFKTSSWVISEIEDLKTKNKIFFNYDSYQYSTREQIATQFMFSNDTPQTIDNQESFVQKNIKAKKLTSIIFNKGRIRVNYSNPYERTDISGEYFIKKIEILDLQSKLIKKVKFDYTYFSNRLQLKSLTDFDTTGNYSLPPHQFVYEESINLPDKESNAIDHWGYYNEQNDNQSLEPKRLIKYTVVPNDTIQTIWGSGNRDTWDNSNTSNIGALKEIIYPTGGESKFYYESHDCVCKNFLGKQLNKKEIFLNISYAKRGKNISISDLGNLPYTVFSLSGLNIIHNGLTYYPYYKVYLDGVLFKAINFRVAPNDQKSISTDITGTYKFVLSYYDYNMNELTSIDYPDPIIANISWFEEDNTINKKIGGFRIGRVEDYDSNSILINSTEYSYQSDNGNSSGKLFTIPNYIGYAFPYIENGSDLVKGITRLVQPFIPIQNHNGSHIVYTKIRKTQNGTNNNGYIDYYYSYQNDSDFTGSYMAKRILPPFFGEIEIPAYKETYPTPPKRNNSHARGLLEKEVHYNNNNKKVFERENFYTTHTIWGIPDDTLKIKGLTFFSFPGELNSITPTYYYLSSGLSFLDKTVDTYFYNDSISQSTQYKRNLDFYNLPIETSTILSNGDILKTETTYVFNKTSKTLAEQDLYLKNILYLPLLTKSYKDNILLSSQYSIYNDDNQKWPNLNLPEKIQTSKGSQSLEDRLIYYDYDDKGNPLEVSKKDGTHTVYIWGYYQKYPIAKIENTTYADLETAIAASPYNTSISTIQTKSNLDNDRTIDVVNSSGVVTSYIGSEGTLRSALNFLRKALPNAQVSTFTYDPLIGVTSVTEPRGQTVYYVYDTFNRLEYIKDSNGKILSKNEYHYKN